MNELELLRLYLHYDPLTGDLRWRTGRDRHPDESQRAYKGWLTRFAGKEASTPLRVRHHVYRVLKLRSRMRHCHRVAWQLHHGCEIPPGYNVLCRNGDYTDLRASNLALGEANVNQGRTKSGVRGVSWDAEKQSWRVQVRGRSYGRFLRFEDAAASSLAARSIQVSHIHGEAN